MLELPTIERVLFYFVLLNFAGAAILAVRSVTVAESKCRRALVLLVACGVCFEGVILAIRAASIKAFPLTGLFESMIVLTIVFSLIYIFFSRLIPQVWFGAIMVWIVLFMAILSGFVASEAVELIPVAQTPWVIVHGLSMIFAGSTLAFSASMAGLFLVCRRKLKQKKLTGFIGRMPSIDKLECLNVIGLKISFMMMTLGLASGIVMAKFKAEALELRMIDWVSDSKFVIILVAWILVGSILAMHHAASWRGKRIARMTIVAFFLTLFALAGATIFCNTKHDFRGEALTREQTGNFTESTVDADNSCWIKS